MKLPIDLQILRDAIADDSVFADVVISQTTGMPTPVGMFRSALGSVLSGVGTAMANAGEATKPQKATKAKRIR